MNNRDYLVYITAACLPALIAKHEPMQLHRWAKDRDMTVAQWLAEQAVAIAQETVKRIDQ